MKTVSKAEFDAFIASRAGSHRVVKERDIEYSCETYIDNATGEEIAFVSYHSTEPTTHHIVEA